jgi:hypothetical protein
MNKKKRSKKNQKMMRRMFTQYYLFFQGRVSWAKEFDHLF